MMRFTSPVTTLLTGVLAFASLPAFGWQDTNSRAPGLMPASDHVAPAVRTARNNIYAGLVQNLPSLLEGWSPDKPPRITQVTITALPELPVGISQVIVIGKITSITPWLTPGNKGLYSEYRVAVDSVLMNRSSWQQDPTLDLLQSGGSVYIPNLGSVTSRVSGIGEQIDTGRTYLLFLNYEPRAQCFTFVKAWDVTVGQALAVRNDDLLRMKQHTSTVYGLPLQDLVARVQALVSAMR